MSVDFYRVSPGKFDSRTPSRKTLNRWTGRILAIILALIILLLIILAIILMIMIRTVHLSRVFLLRVLESNFPGDSL